MKNYFLTKFTFRMSSDYSKKEEAIFDLFDTYCEMQDIALKEQYRSENMK